MDIERLFSDFNIPITREGEKHYRQGWVNTQCPYCTGNPGNHLGFNLSGNYFYCWRCGAKRTEDVLSKLIGVSIREIKNLISKYKGNYKPKIKSKIINKKAFKLPKSIPITDSKLSLSYLNKRGFNDHQISLLQDHFHLSYSSMGYCDNIDLSYRLIIPILYEDKMVSWTSRDLTNKSSLRYITCPETREKMKHKHILYNAPDSDYIILVEGPFDVWKVFLAGYPSTCCFGVSITNEQMLLLSKYKRVYLFLDPDKAGIKTEVELEKRLLFMGVDVFKIKKTKKDPGDLNVSVIKKLLEGVK